jgi:hypothetical protein
MEFTSNVVHNLGGHNFSTRKRYQKRDFTLTPIPFEIISSSGRGNQMSVTAHNGKVKKLPPPYLEIRFESPALWYIF